MYAKLETTISPFARRNSMTSNVRSSTEKIPLPVTVSDLLEIPEDEEKYKISSFTFNTIRTIGKVVEKDVDENRAFIAYSICDTMKTFDPKSAPRFTCIKSIEIIGVNAGTQSSNQFAEGTIISAVGKLRLFNDRLNLVCFRCRAIESDEEIDNFYLEARLSFLFYAKNIPERSALQMEELALPLFSTLPPSDADVKYDFSQADSQPAATFMPFTNVQTSNLSSATSDELAVQNQQAEHALKMEIADQNAEILEVNQQGMDVDENTEESESEDDVDDCMEEEEEVSIENYASKLFYDAPEIVRRALVKILSILRSNREIDDQALAELNDGLFQDSRIRNLIGKCLGAVGTTDKEMIMPADTAASFLKKNQSHMSFINDRITFYRQFIEMCLNCYDNCMNSGIPEAADQFAVSIRRNIEEIKNIRGGRQLSTELSEEVRLQVILNFREQPTGKTTPVVFVNSELPVIENVDNAGKWVEHWFRFATDQVKDCVLQRSLLSLTHIECNAAAKLMGTLLPNVILQVIMDGSEVFIEKFQEEVISAFSAFLRLLKNDDCVRSVISVIFAILDFLEKFAIENIVDADSSIEKAASKRIEKLLHHILSQSNNDEVPLCVLACEKHNCYFRALKWLEYYGIRNESGAVVFKRQLFYRLEHLYISLGDVDGVNGAFSYIAHKTTPTANEEILALQAIGNYSDALFLCQSRKGQEIALIKCLLRLNQAHSARNNVECYLGSPHIDEKSKQILLDQQIEAMSKMGDWDQLGTVLRDRDQQKGIGHLNSNVSTVQSWGARLASIISSLKQFDQSAGHQRDFRRRVRSARLALMNSLSAVTFESTETCSQLEKYIIRLHALKEVEDVKDTLYNSENKIDAVQLLLDKWEKRPEATNTSIDLLEPIISLRTELLRATRIVEDDSKILCQLLLQRSRLARRQGHLQTAFTYLAEARQTGCQSIDIDLETARFHFQKREHTQAVNCLQKSIQLYYPEMASELLNFTKTNRIGNKKAFQSFETRKPFVEAQLLLAEFKEKSGAGRQEDLVRIYQGLDNYGEKSETFYYHYAIFFDNYCESINELTEDLVCYLLRLYRLVLEQGAKYLHNVMPRMLTVWFDLSQKCTPTRSSKSAASRSANSNARTGTNMPTDPSLVMVDAFNTIDHYYFYTAFSQLISRITHQDTNIFKALKTILADLIADYPHQCLWRSIAISRSKTSKFASRSKRCDEVYNLAKKKCSQTNLDELIKQYDYLAESLIRVAEDAGKTRIPPIAFSKAFPFLSQFFENGAMEPRKSSSKRSAALSNLDSPITLNESPPMLVLPFVEDVLEMQNFDESMFMSQIEVREINRAKPVYSFREIFIAGVDEEYEVLKSNANPKKMAFIASDGKKYSLLAKANDEMRKDSRFMDVEKMLNSLFLRDTDARRRHLYIRNYSVIPLQEAGGIVEWVPDLVTLAAAATPLMKEKAQQPLMTNSELQRIFHERLAKDERLKIFRECYPRCPLVMAEWLRRTFIDAGKWYKARLAFTRTTATMSMAGFILGLGDRHSENLLIDTTSGDVVHVDFNMLFDKAEYLRVPEVVPFRLTRNMVNAFGSTGVHGTFRKSSEVAMRVMRNEERMIVTILQTFVHDPLLEWTTTESRNQQTKHGNTNALIECPEAKNSLENIRLRLAGNIVTSRFHRPKHNNVSMSVEGQVAMLIEMATSESELSKMYIGWNPLL